MLTQQIIWNLNEFFPSPTSPKIEEAIKEATVTADTFENKYRGKIAMLTPEGLLECLQDIEAFEAKFSDLILYANLNFSADMTQPQSQQLHDRTNKLNAKISKQLAFYSLELGKLIKAKPELIDNPTLSNYKHMLQRVHRRVEHQLSEIEEQLVIEKDQ